MNAFNFGQLVKQAVDPQDALSKMRVQQVYADRAAAMKRQGLDANKPADLAKFKGGWTGPMAPSTSMSQPPRPQTQPSQAFDPFDEIERRQDAADAKLRGAANRAGISTNGSYSVRGAVSNGAVQKVNGFSPPQPKAPPASFTSFQPKVTSTPVDGAALAKQVQQMQQQTPPPSPPPPAPAPSSSWSWANQTNPQPPQAGPLSAPMSNVSTSFNNATGQQDPPHIITTDNGRKFNTQTKQFLDGRPGGFAR